MQLLRLTMLDGLLTLFLVWSQRMAMIRKESFASSVIRNLETSLRSWAKRFFASWRLIVFRLRRNCLPDRLIRL